MSRLAQGVSRTVGRLAPADVRRNYYLFLTEGVVYFAGLAFFEPATVIPVLVGTLTDSSVVVGLVTAVRYGFWLLPQVVVAGYVSSFPYKKPLMVWAGVAQKLSILGMAVVVYFLAASRPELTLALFFLLYALSCVNEGVASLTWSDVVGKSVDERGRGRLFGLMQFVGGMVAFFAGLLVKRILEDVPYPVNYSLILTIGVTVAMASPLCLYLIREPQGVVSEMTGGVTASLRRLHELWRGSPPFARMMRVRILGSFLFMSMPFLIIYGREVLGIPTSFIGLFVSAQMLGGIVAGPLMGYMCDAVGTRKVLILTVATALAAPVVALLAGPLQAAGYGAVTQYLYALVFIAMGFFYTGNWIGFINHLLATVPVAERPSYIGLMNALIAPCAGLSLLGGLIIRFVSYEATFLLTAGAVGLGLFYALSLEESRGAGGALEEAK